MKNICVIGAGTMGSGIAHLFAQHEFIVSLVDVSQVQLKLAMDTMSKNFDRQIAKGALSVEAKEMALGRISTFTALEKALKGADLVVEAATENLETKLNLFRQIDQLAPAPCILASNTSSISITKIASVTKRPAQVIGMHFMNPVPIMKLVEIINGYATDQNVAVEIEGLSKKLGKIPCVVKDYPGFIANRILMPMINEAIYSLFEQVAGVTEIDTIMKLGMAHPMGPLQLADFIGLDVCLSILNVLQQGFGNPKYAPCPLLIKMVTANMLGIKTGEGFYIYATGSKELRVSNQFQ